MILIDNFSKPGSQIKANEDACFVNENFGFVIDGASGYGNVKITNDDSDSKWFSNAWKEYLMENLNSLHLSISQIVKNGIVKVDNKLKKFPNYKLALIKPSAAIAIFRINGDLVEYFALADCSLVITLKDNSTHIITTDDITQIDKRNLSLIHKKAKEQNIPPLEAKKLPEIREVFIEMFKNRNTSLGGYVLSDNVHAVDHANIGTFALNNVKSILGFSDGFSQIFDLFNYVTPQKLSSDIISGSNFEKYYNKLFELQNKDKACETYPRTKIRDDATAFKFVIM